MQRQVIGGSVLLFAFLLGSGHAEATTKTMVAIINGAQQPTPVDSPAIGCGRFIIDTEMNTVSYRIAITGLVGPETMSHIHGPAGPGVGAGPLHALPAGNPKIGVWNYSESDEATILNGLTYVNLHTTAFGAGELRGQIVDMVALIDGPQQTPPVVGGGSGWGTFMIDTDTNSVSYHIVLAGLSSPESPSHIHGFAPHTMGGAPLHPLPAGSPKIGVWNYTEDQEGDILNGLAYVNIHTSGFPGGEVRGQITPIVVPIDGEQAGSGVSDGSGCAFVSIDLDGDRLGYDIALANLTGPETMSHIHGYAAAGAGAGALTALPSGERKTDIWDYPTADESMIQDGLTYINIHTGMFAAGEIRGQIEFPVVRSTAPVFVRGDINDDGGVDIADAILALGVLFSMAGPEPCADAMDTNDDGGKDVADPIYLLATLFSMGPPPAAPHPDCGVDPTADALDCANYTSCP